MCPDELESNKLGAVLDVTTRAYEWPLRPVDIGHGRDGRVLEMLSEHNCQGWLEGYILTGRHGLFPSYEAFVEIVTGMANQLAKFLKVARELPWRPPVSSFNYLLTSEGWRQEHNGYSHQGPGFINAMLNKKASVSRVLPPARREHAARGDGTLSHVDELDQPRRRVETTAPAMADHRRGPAPLCGRRIDLGVGRHRRSRRARRRLRRVGRDPDDRDARRGAAAPPRSPRAQDPRRQRRRPARRSNLPTSILTV